jgi:hypothetical protein
MNNMKSFLVHSLILLLLFLSSCSTIVTSLYGLKSNKHRSVESIEKYSKKYKIPNQDLYVIDSSYISFIHDIDSSDWQLAKKHFQPLQALYFDHSGTLISFHNNCFAGGFPNLKWNRDGIFEKFVPKSQIAVDSLLNFEKQLQYLKTIKGDKLNPSNYSSANYNVVVYWGVNWGRQSKRLIKYIKANCNLAKNESINILFANDDEFLEYFIK